MKAASPLLSPHHLFTKEEWGRLRADTPLTLTQTEVEKLQSLNDPVPMEEVEKIYLPLSRLLSLYVHATQGLFHATEQFLGKSGTKVPYIIGIAGSVAVGKSTAARLLQALLQRWPNIPKVDLITTDGFLYANERLASEGLMERKGFPESYDLPALLHFLDQIKAGASQVEAPVYSHVSYDVVKGEKIVVSQPDILIVEGLNVLQTSKLPRDGKAIPFVSDYFDFSIYLDAPENSLQRWYVERFMRLRQTSFTNPQSYFHRLASISDKEARAIADRLWSRINLINLHENILPTRPRADLVLEKADDHRIHTVWLRKL